ncbi:MAG: hypothetical protein QOJ46_791 [bacterium]
MRIALIVPGTLDGATGGYLYDRMLARHLAAQGDEVEVVSLPWRGYGLERCDMRSAALARRLAQGHFDVLLQDELAHPSLLRVNRRLRAPGTCPIVAVVHVLRATEHASSRLRSRYASAERRYLATVDGAVYTSCATQAATTRLAGPRLTGVVARPGADHIDLPAGLATVTRRARGDGPLRVLCIANVVRPKRVDVLVRALARLPRDGWRLTVVGSLTADRRCARRLRRLVDRCGLAANVRLTGEVPNADVAAFLEWADVLAGVSSYESLGIAYLEAMRMGLPVLASAAGGAREIVEHGREGLLVEPGDVDALAGHLGRLASDRDLLLRMSGAAAARAARHPGWERSLAPVRSYLLGSVAGLRDREAA